MADDDGTTAEVEQPLFERPQRFDVEVVRGFVQQQQVAADGQRLGQQKPVKFLSGGERNRLLLAKTLTVGGNLLLLDEPTNDLDVDTLRALEEALEDFAGCAVIISHDRWFLDRIATHILAFEGESHVEWFEGNFQDYEEDKKRRLGEDSVMPKRIKYKQFSR